VNTHDLITQAGKEYRINEILQKISQYSEHYLGRPLTLIEKGRLCAILCGYTSNQIAEIEGISLGSARVFTSNRVKELLISVLDDKYFSEKLSLKDVLKLLAQSPYKLIDLYEFDNVIQCLQPLRPISLNQGSSMIKPAIRIRRLIELHLSSNTKITNSDLTFEDLESKSRQYYSNKSYSEAIDLFYEQFKLDPTAFGCLIKIVNCYDHLKMTNDVLVMADFCVHLLKINESEIKTKNKGLNNFKFEKWMVRALTLLAGHYQDKGDSLQCPEHLQVAINTYKSTLDFQPLDLVVSWDILQCSLSKVRLLYGSVSYELANLKALAAQCDFIGRINEPECSIKKMKWDEILEDIDSEIQKVDQNWAVDLQRLKQLTPRFVD
jgi:tetratricopeptide (TPR) repeat protein